MDSLGRPISNLKSKTLAGAAVLALLATGCDSPVDITAFDPPLDQMACQDADVPGLFSFQTAGTFTLGNLAGLAPDPEARRKELRDAGLRAGYFANWREATSRPPFDPPADLTCQVLAFENGEQAAAFVRDIVATPDGVVSSAITWLPRDERVVEEIAAPESAPDGARAFRIAARDADVEIQVFAVVVQNGSYVQSVYVGGQGDVDVKTPAELATELFERTAGASGASDPPR
ncbi:MAG: hypothetical protein ACSLFM_10930 [Tepidiformaceae bacterium]